MAKMKAGNLAVAVEEEEILWYDRKRSMFFGLPWSFTRYYLTPTKLKINVGLLSRKEEEVRLYRVTDVTFKQSFFEKLLGVGTVCILSSDNSMPELHLRHIKNAKKVKDVLSQCVENNRRSAGVRTSELVGGGPIGCSDTFGPRLFPDANHDGVDDRLQ